MSDKRKLYTIVGGGFGGNLRKALVSYLYPVKVEKDVSSTSIPSIVSADLREAIFVNEIEVTIFSIPGIISAEMPSIQKLIELTEVAGRSIPSIVSAVMNEGKFLNELEEADLSIPAIVSAQMITPIFINVEIEESDLSIPTIISASFT